MGAANSDEPADCDDDVGTDFNRKACFDDMVNRVKTAQAQLEQAYPLGGCPLFPDRRVWHNKTNDMYFELTQIRIKYWAANIVRDGLRYTRMTFAKYLLLGLREM